MPRLDRFPEHYLERLIESSPDIVVAVDRAGTIIFYNDGAEKNLGYTAAEILGQNVVPALSVAARKRTASWRRCAATSSAGPGKVKNFETDLRRPAGASTSRSPSPARSCTTTTASRSARSASPRTSARSASAIGWRRSARSPSALCHEINNPLEVILNDVELLERFVAPRRTGRGGGRRGRARRRGAPRGAEDPGDRQPPRRDVARAASTARASTSPGSR